MNERTKKKINYSIGIVDIEQGEIRLEPEHRSIKLFKKPIVKNKVLYLCESDVATLLGFGKFR